MWEKFSPYINCFIQYVQLPLWHFEVSTQSTQSIWLIHNLLPYQISPTTVTGEVFSLAEFVSLYKHSLPLRIRVKGGFCGKDER